MSDLPGRPPIDSPLTDASGRLTPVWAQWLVAFYLYVKRL